MYIPEQVHRQKSDHRDAAMTSNLGKIEGIAASGSGWSTGNASDIKDMFYNTLREAKNLIQISTFSLGNDNDEVNEFFKIIEERLRSERIVNIIVNDNGKKNGTCSQYAKKTMKKLGEKFPEKFLPQYFKSTKSKILHAKITVVDRTIVLIGSANISKNALDSNYEIMLKIGTHDKPAPAAGTISIMLENLSEELKEKNDEV